jgi:hypothetical protein
VKNKKPHERKLAACGSFLFVPGPRGLDKVHVQSKVHRKVHSSLGDNESKGRSVTIARIMIE